MKRHQKPFRGAAAYLDAASVVNPLLQPPSISLSATIG
jgi:hypothetical protein